MSPFYWVRRNHAAILLVVGGFSLVQLLGSSLEPFKLGINPYEFALKALGKVFYLGVALAATQYLVKKFFPTIDKFCSRPTSGGGPSEFTARFESFSKNHDPRLWLSVFVHCAVFVGVCLVLALAF